MLATKRDIKRVVVCDVPQAAVVAAALCSAHKVLKFLLDELGAQLGHF